MSPDDALISKLLNQQQGSEENGSTGGLHEFAIDLEFPHMDEREKEK